MAFLLPPGIKGLKLLSLAKHIQYSNKVTRTTSFKINYFVLFSYRWTNACSWILFYCWLWVILWQIWHFQLAYTCSKSKWKHQKNVLNLRLRYQKNVTSLFFVNFEQVSLIFWCFYVDFEPVNANWAISMTFLLTLIMLLQGIS